MEKLVWQMFILGTGNYLNTALNKGLGGVIFFSKDILSKEKFQTLIKNIKKESKIYPFLSIDQEGGRVERTENIRPKRLSPKFAFEKGKEFLITQTTEMADELLEYGINLNFAPSADVNTNPNNPIIGERAFSDKTDEVIECAKTVSKIYAQKGIIPCIKHYPGHGDADKDSHLTLPHIDLSFEEMKNIHIKPFELLAKDGAEMIMAAHLYCKCFDENIIPASLSKNAIGYLRNNIGYDGIIISDDMVMKGVQDYGSKDAIIMGINAGLDMFIFRQSDKDTFETIEKIVDIVKNDNNLFEKVLKSNERISKLKKKFGLV